MTLEISHGKSAYQFRIAPDDARIIERRINKKGARWYWWMARRTEKEATASLLRLTERQHERDADADAGGAA